MLPILQAFCPQVHGLNDRAEGCHRPAVMLDGALDLQLQRGLRHGAHVRGQQPSVLEREEALDQRTPGDMPIAEELPLDPHPPSFIDCRVC